MGIANINMLQHPEDVAYLTSDISNDYYIHALANMGQRLGVFDETALKYNVINYNNDLNKTIKIDTVYDDTFTFDADLIFEISINNIEAYKQKSQVINDGVNFKSLLFGKLLGTDNDDPNNIEIQYTDIDIKKNIIVEAWRAFYLQNDIYIIMHLELSDTLYNKYKYKLRTYKCLIDSTFTDARTCFNSTTYESNNINDEERANLFNELDVTKIGSNYGFFFNLIYGNSKSSISKASGFCLYSEAVIENNYTLDLEIDTIGENSEQYLKISDTSAMTRSYENVHDTLYFDVYGLDKRVHILNVDLIKVYPNILKYYSELRFNLNNTRLKEILVRAIYNELYAEYYTNRIINEASEVNENDPILEISPEFEITYLSKVDNALKIYYTNDIYINFRNFNDNKSTAQFPLVFWYNGNSKISVYNISVNYNEKYPEFIDTIDVIKKYTLPYINDSNYWVINDTETSNYSIGEDAGNPNIMILKTTKINGKIDHVKLNRFDIYDEDLEYENLYISSIEDINRYNYLFYVPKIIYGNNKLKYANLIIISDVVQDKNGNTYMSQPYTTIWTINKDGDKFELLKDSNGNNLTINSLLGMDMYLFNKLTEYNSTNNVFEDLIALKINNNLLINDTLSANESDSFRLLTLSTIKNDDFSKPESEFNYNHIYLKLNTEGHYKDVNEIHMDNTFFNDNSKYVALNGTNTITPYSYNVAIMSVDKVESEITGIQYETTTPRVTHSSGWTINNAQNEDTNPTVGRYNLMGAGRSGNSTGTAANAASMFGEEAVVEAEPQQLTAANVMERLTDFSASEYNSNISVNESNFDVVVPDTNSNNDTGHQQHISYVINNNGELIYVTEAMSSHTIRFTEYYNEYLPQAYVPMLDTSEILMLNQNNINRLNILSFDENNKIYYSYIGTSFTENDKSILHIGTNNTNINAGTDTLFNSNNIFNVQDTICIDHKNLHVNSSSVIFNQTKFPIINEGLYKSISFSLNIFPYKFLDVANSSGEKLTLNAINNDVLKNIYYIKPDVSNIDEFLIYLRDIAKEDKIVKQRGLGDDWQFSNHNDIKLASDENQNSHISFIEEKGIFIYANGEAYIVLNNDIKFTLIPYNDTYYIHSKLFFFRKENNE